MKINSWSPPSNLLPQQLLVVACTSHFFDNDYVQDVILPEEWGLDLHCTFSSDLSLIPEADALWFHGPSIRSLPNKIPGQKWIVMSMESDINYPFLKQKRAMDLFDIHMTYQLHSDIPTLYPNWHQYGEFLDPPLPIEAKKKHTSSTLYAASNPVDFRDQYVKELMNYMAIDSIGKCMNNKNISGFPTGRRSWEGNGFSALIAVIQSYKFYLAFENSHTRDYVTERVFQALISGTVPVYWGAENILDFMPDKNAIINVNDFSHPQQLANYLEYLDNNDVEYQKHLAWKSNGYSSTFKQLVDISSIEPLKRMFVKLAHGCGHDCNCGGRLR